MKFTDCFLATNAQIAYADDTAELNNKITIAKTAIAFGVVSFKMA